MKSGLSRASRIENTLKAQFSPVVFDLADESALHAGHGGARPEGQTHFRLRMVAPAFAGLSRVERQRLIHDTLREEFVSGLHALALDLKAPGET